MLDSVSYIVNLNADGEDDGSNNDDGDTVNPSEMLHIGKAVRVTLTRTYSFRGEGREEGFKVIPPNSKVILQLLVNKSQMFMHDIVRFYTHTTHTHVYVLDMSIQEQPGGL